MPKLIAKASGRVPFIDLVQQHKSLRRSIEARWDRLFRTGQFVLGEEVREFEERIAKYLGVKNAIGCASGTDALRLALQAIGIGPKDEVITTAFSFFATASAILQEGAVPVFVDIDERTYNLDPSLVAAKIGPKTRAILPVHLYGCPADMDAISRIARKNGLKIIEDVAQAIGASIRGKKVGTIGDIGCFSFYPTKNLGAMGDGGLVCTDNDDHAERLRILRVHGSQKKYVHDMVGMNSRLDSLQAAVLNSKLAHLDRWNAKRREIAEFYHHALADLPVRLPMTPKGFHHVYHLFVIACEQRDALAAFLASKGIEAAVYYPATLPLQPCLADLGYQEGDFPKAEWAAREVLAIPESPELSMPQARRVAAAIKEFFGS